jgi:hypothetical protein
MFNEVVMMNKSLNLTARPYRFLKHGRSLVLLGFHTPAFAALNEERL